MAPHKKAREALFKKMADNSALVLRGNPVRYRNRDAEWPFRQDSYFYYLTGFDQENAAAIFIKKNKQNHYWLFCEENDPAKAQWVGEKWGPLQAKRQFRSTSAFSIEAFDSQLEQILRCQQIYLLPEDKSLYQQVIEKVSLSRRSSKAPGRLVNAYHDASVLLDELRLIKSPDEIEIIQKACDISVNAHLAAMRHTRPGLFEYEVEALLMQSFYQQGARSTAYPNIVAGGANACILHYTQNQAKLPADGLLLIDAGAEWHNYAADITRTFPIDQQFTGEQRAIYELVLAAQMAGIEQVGPDTTWNQIQQTILEIMVQGLVDLKILQGAVSDLIEQQAYLPFYMHGSGHWLGLDVHDVGDYQINDSWRPLITGMVFTIEPGLYFAENLNNIDEKWRGIGVRIEDDILITEKGAKVLTGHLPKTVDAIEAIRRGQ